MQQLGRHGLAATHGRAQPGQQLAIGVRRRDQSVTAMPGAQAGEGCPVQPGEVGIDIGDQPRHDDLDRDGIRKPWRPARIQPLEQPT